MTRTTKTALESNSALFLDFDGTLAEIAPRPESVLVAPEVVSLLQALRERLDGALAVVSGRPIAQLDSFLAPLQFAAAGSHGAERRSAAGAVTRLQEPDMSPVIASLQAVAALHPGLLLEVKPGAVALHYRLAPHSEGVVQQAMQAALGQTSGMVLMNGKMVVELKPANASKGKAISAFLDEAPFTGRRPFFAGDDTTDESGFAAVQALGGVGVKIGPGPTLAKHRLDSPTHLRAWLQAAATGEPFALLPA